MNCLSANFRPGPGNKPGGDAQSVASHCHVSHPHRTPRGYVAIRARPGAGSCHSPATGSISLPIGPPERQVFRELTSISPSPPSVPAYRYFCTRHCLNAGPLLTLRLRGRLPAQSRWLFPQSNSEHDTSPVHPLVGQTDNRNPWSRLRGHHHLRIVTGSCPALPTDAARRLHSPNQSVRSRV